MYGENQLIEDLVDLLDIEARKGEPAYPLEEVLEHENKRRGLTIIANVQRLINKIRKKRFK